MRQIRILLILCSSAFFLGGCCTIFCLIKPKEAGAKGTEPAGKKGQGVPTSKFSKKEGAMSVYEFKAKDIEGKEKALSDYKGKTLLIVNVASQCGFTPQYAGLEKLREKYKDKGFEVLGFPCNQFGSQEPGTEKEIKAFCETSFGVKFPLFSKVEVNGEGTHPLWAYLKKAQPGVLGSEAIKWNFTKFLVDKEGKAVRRYASADKPEDIEKDIEQILKN